MMESIDNSISGQINILDDKKPASAFVGVPDIRDKQKIIFANIFSVISVLVALAFAASVGISESGLIFLGYSFLALINYLLFLATKRSGLYEKGVILLAAASSVVFFTKGGYTGFLWLFLFPYAAYFLAGIKNGSIYSFCVALIGLITMITSSGPVPLSGINGFEAKFCFLAIYVSCCVLALTYEAARQDAREKLIDANIQMNSRSAEHDLLTGLMTGVQLRERANQEAARYDRFQRPFCFLRCNIDCFGIINEKYGFDCGDSMLKAVADKMNAMLRETDLAARWGGSEYLILLTETTAERGLTVGDRLRKSIEDSSWGWKNKRLNLTLSIGLSLFDPSDGIDGSIRIADERAARAGKFGGNRVEGPVVGIFPGRNF
ncbi:GGDEF domain-containing protein [Desulforegula conservatrix]|uniref:GGDEF domain-containing protein n=1 Tax=Desulforegula conservatrix TaxID=153026 RepID=UPI000A02C66E|nr:GGDEF domain-containing protein [Desulforegula conservatrix]